MQTTRQGFLFVLDRRTGEPLFPIEDRPVPASDAEGEVAAPTQPFALTPPPTNDPFAMPEVWGLADAASLGQCSRERERFRYEGIFTPPSETGTLMYPGTAVANNWGGAAVDPRTGILHLNSMRVVQIIRLVPRADYDDPMDGGDEIEGGNEEGYHPQEGAPYGIHLTEWRNWLGLPCWAPPYGTFSAYDLGTGERLYEVPFGRSQQ